MDLGLVDTAFDLTKKLVEFIKSWPKWLKITAVMFIILGLPLTGFYWGVSSTRQPTSPGGIDLGKYCISYDLTLKGRDLCYKQIDLTAACRWQYTEPDLTFRLTSSDANSGQCFEPSGNLRGGINDMRGYCRKLYGNTTVDAVLAGNTWECQSKINPDAACNWQYQRDDLEARDEDGKWICYD